MQARTHPFIRRGKRTQKLQKENREKNRFQIYKYTWQNRQFILTKPKGKTRQRCALSACVNQQFSDIKDRGKKHGCGLEWQKASDLSACVQTGQREFYKRAIVSDIGRILHMKTASQEGCFCSWQGCMLSYFRHSSCHRIPPPVHSKVLLTVFPFSLFAWLTFSSTTLIFHAVIPISAYQ